MDKRVLSIDINGKVTKEEPGCINQFTIIGDKIYQKTIAWKEANGMKKGEVWESSTPFNIIGRGRNIPFDPSVIDKLTGAGRIKQQSVIIAARIQDNLLARCQTDLIIGDDYYFEYRPILGFSGVSIFTGNRIK